MVFMFFVQSTGCYEKPTTVRIFYWLSKVSKFYFIPYTTSQHQSVYLQFLCGTLNINCQIIDFVLVNRGAEGIFVGGDRRKGHKVPSAIDEAIVLKVKEHIHKNTPKMEKALLPKVYKQALFSFSPKSTAMYRLFS